VREILVVGVDLIASLDGHDRVVVKVVWDLEALALGGWSGRR
jgi:hypothetical protein